MSQRDENGRFKPGCPAGPGRPKKRRLVEIEFLAALAESVSLDDWKAVCTQAVAAAKGGDATARAWLSRWLMSRDSHSLADLCELELAGRSIDRLLKS